MRHTLSVLLENKPGALMRIASMFARRGYNIESLAVGPTERHDVSRITLRVDCEQHPLEQIEKQMHKLVNVLRATDLGPGEAIERELLLAKVAVTPDRRAEVMSLADVFHKQKAHLSLAGYIESRELNDRRVVELPWQLGEAKEWERLKDCVADLEMLLEFNTDAKPFELVGYWLMLGNRYDIVETYKASFERYKQSTPAEQGLSRRYQEVALLLAIIAKYEDAELFYQQALGIQQKILGPKHPDTIKILNDLILLLVDTEHYERAEVLCRQVLAIRQEVLGLEHPNTIESLFPH